jgi:lysophospholipase L1-like esterase
MRSSQSVAVVSRGFLPRASVVAAAIVIAVAGLAWDLASPPRSALAGCMIYVAAGDDVTNGHDLSDNSKRYPEQLVEDHIKTPGWCLYNQGKNSQTTSGFINEGGLASSYNMRPDLITIQLGEQNDPVKNLLDDCFDKVKDHQFLDASSCAAQILANTTVWDNMRKNYTTILQLTRIMQMQRPKLVTAVVNYPNPYPQAQDVISPYTQMCTQLVDTMLTCMQRWSQLPPALIVIDQVYQKLNQTLKDAVASFQTGPNGYRWVYVDVYPKFKSHCMAMKVSIFTTVYHPPSTVDAHNSTNNNIGCSQNWFTETYSGSRLPDYLPPASNGVLLTFTQTTTSMGKYPNADGHQCIADAIWDADTILPGQTPLKWILGSGEESKEPCN